MTATTIEKPKVAPPKVKFKAATSQEVDWLCRVVNGRRLKYVKRVR